MKLSSGGTDGRADRNPVAKCSGTHWPPAGSDPDRALKECPGPEDKNKGVPIVESIVKCQSGRVSAPTEVTKNTAAQMIFPFLDAPCS